MGADPPLEKAPPRVFISYSHDSAEHCNRVLALATRLRADGLNAQLDQFEDSPPQGWPIWCARQILDSNYVLIICTALYRDRFLGLEDFGKGRGVKWEAKVIHNILYYEEVNSGFIPVIFDASDADHIPETVKDASWYLVSPNGENSSDYTQLRQRLAGNKTFSSLPIPPPSEAYRQRDDASVLTEEVWDSSRQILTAINDIKSDTEKIQRGINKLLSILEKGLLPPSTPERPHNLPPWMAPAYFIGREQELRTLCGGLTALGGNGLAVVQPQVIQGEGGIGKTRLAIQVAWVLYLQRHCEMAFIVSASSPAELDTQLAAIDAPSLLDLYDGEQPPRELDIRKQNVIQALREMTGRWILVLDAADSDKARNAVSELLSQLASGRFLVTSRREDWPRTTVSKLPLSLFTIEEARTCLLSRYWKPKPPVEETADFDRVAIELGFLPLALVLAASYMDSRRIPPHDT
jgi:SEFIR domain